MSNSILRPIILLEESIHVNFVKLFVKPKMPCISIFRGGISNKLSLHNDQIPTNFISIQILRLIYRWQKVKIIFGSVLFVITDQKRLLMSNTIQSQNTFSIDNIRANFVKLFVKPKMHCLCMFIGSISIKLFPDIDQSILEFLRRDDTGLWHCLSCDQSSRNRIHLMSHVESKHI